MADSQVPWAVEALTGTVTEPAWKNKPSYYVVTTEDQMIPPAAQRAMAERIHAVVTEVTGSHAVFIAKPMDVAKAILKAAEAIG
jgi:pimeloyl-ACP methyl ester carboxylesterase